MQRTRYARFILLAALLIGPTLMVAGCNTAHGVGKDVERSGEWIQRKTN